MSRISRRAASRSFPADPRSLRDVREFVRGVSQRNGFPPSAVDDLVLAVSEAATNALAHSGTAEILVRCTPAERCLEVAVEDRGMFRRQVPMPEIEGAGGHGISLMLALMDEVSIRQGTAERPGTVVRLRKCPEP